jgi:cytochrome c oxidase assembly protein subunit 15
MPEMAFAPAFALHRELGMDASGNLLTREALTAIHWVHRVWALVVLAFAGYAVFRLVKQPGLSGLGGLLGLLLLVQVSLGMANVWLGLPLPVAVMHNAGAALLLIVLVVINFRLFRMR